MLLVTAEPHLPIGPTTDATIVLPVLMTEYPVVPTELLTVLQTETPTVQAVWTAPDAQMRTVPVPPETEV